MPSPPPPQRPWQARPWKLASLTAVSIWLVVCLHACPEFDLAGSLGIDGIRLDDESQLALAEQMGAAYMRVGFLWHQMQKGPQEPIDFDFMDKRVNTLVGRGSRHTFKVLGILYGSAPWAADCDRRYPLFPDCHDDPNYPPSEDHLDEYEHFVSETVRHFRDRVKEWEVWNEPNIGFRFWKPTIGGDPDAYGTVLKAAYRGIKGDPGDPADGVCEECTVLFGGVFHSGAYTFFYETSGLGTPGGLRFIDLVHQHHPDIAGYFDAISLHPYMYACPAVFLSPFTAPEERTAMMGYDVRTKEYRPANYLDAIRDTRSLLAHIGAPDKPIWITESGWPTNYEWVGFFLPTGVSFLQQAQYLVRSFVLSLGEGVEKIIWWGFHDGPRWAMWQEESFGLIGDTSNPDYPDRPKPSYYAYRTLATQLSRTYRVQDVREALSLAPDVEFGYRFTGERKQVTVLWRVSGNRSIDVPLGRPGSAVRGLSMLGEELPVRVTCSPSGCRAVGIEISPSPVYLVEVLDEKRG
jgi:hypothetical protein